MHPKRIEKLRQEYTDQYVAVDPERPDLARFKGAVGRVVTVNFNGRALVEFDLNSNRGRYDIELDYLKVVDKPEPKTPPAKAKPAAAKAKPAAAAKAKAGKPGPAKETPSKPAESEDKPKTEEGASVLPTSPTSKPQAPGEEEDRENLSELELARLEKGKPENKESAEKATDAASSSEGGRENQAPKADVPSNHDDSQ